MSSDNAPPKVTPETRNPPGSMGMEERLLTAAAPSGSSSSSLSSSEFGKTLWGPMAALHTSIHRGPEEGGSRASPSCFLVS
ncbi:hypothetical protein EYF80_061319 [Liparis tanakae]|uniref:Uncharacterized protein n=1 Tax=Liparis tanakae TaxID=230148 RepID=A0A4Z2EJL5_9TELE|nr:hypothetical protein EYF80_061319 [Liparis tanakae]